MKRLLIKGIKFLAAAVALYALAFFTLCHVRFQGKPLIYRSSDYYQWKGGVAWATFHEYDPTRQWDALIIGSSHAYRGYDPHIFKERGYPTFNLGSSAQSPMNSYYVLKNLIDPKKTKLVIFDMYENAFDGPGLESTAELTQNIPSDGAALDMAIGLHDLRGLNLMALRCFTRGDTSMYADPTYKGMGFAGHGDSLLLPVHYDLGRPFEPNEKQVDYFSRCITWCETHAVPLILVSHFYPHQSDHARHAAFAKLVNDRIKGTDIRYLDFAFTHALSDTNHFVDHNHLNAAGVRIFNERLIDSLESEGYLHRK